MSLRILIIPDKFKGTLTTNAAATAIATGWRQARPDDDLELVPMSDGGDGFGAILSGQLHAGEHTAHVVDAAHRPHDARWWHEPTNRTAVVESARAIGLALLPPKQFHPFQLDTRGLGELLLAAAAAGARRCLIGIGGSATNDAGFGMARALGWRFLDRDDRDLETWTELHRLARLQPPRRRRLFPTAIVAVDVQNPLLGPRGCSRIYGPQKGLRSEDFPVAEKICASSPASPKHNFPASAPRNPAPARPADSASACAFLGAKLQPGFALFARHADLVRRLRKVDLVLTGEGALDKSTLMGKGVGELGRLCQRLGIPCLALGGVLTEPRAVKQLFTDARAITPHLTTTENALAQPAHWLTRLAEITAAEYVPPDRG